MSKSIESLAIHYINVGVSHYENGDIENAAIVFAEALATSEHLAQFENICCEESDENTMLEDEIAGPFQPEFGTCEKLTLGCSDIFIFLNPIKVPNMLPATRIHKILTMITMFNLAVCHHRNAIINNMDITSLRKALQLYELTYAIQMQEGIDVTLAPTMIIMSNVGHIHKILGNKESADQCFQHLLSTLMFLIEAGEKDTVWDFDGFFTNILNTIYAGAPAAAA
jgi:hypothetical protein